MNIRPMVRPMLRPMVRAMVRSAFSPLSLFADVVHATFSGGRVGFAVMPYFSTMWQDASQTTLADDNADDVRVIIDDSPNSMAISAPADASRPTIKDSGTSRSLSFDGSADRFSYPLADQPTGVVTFVCSIALTANGYFPQIIGDVSASAGLFFGFSGATRVPRLYLSGISGASPLESSLGALPLNTRHTLSFVYDGVTAKIYQDGVEAASASVTGTRTAGSAPLICYSGANTVVSPIDMFGGVLVGAALTASEREDVEELFAAECYAIGDSTVASYLGGTAIMGLIGSSRTEIDLSNPGDTIAQQKTAWQAQSIVSGRVGWVVMQIGLNDLNPAEAASVAIARLQDLVDTIKADIGARKLLIGQMIPCRQRLINLYGGTDGPVAYQKWLDMNEAIAGEGATPITGVDGRITAHVPLMDDGSGNLKAEYDTGDGIHPNDDGRQVNAAAWENALISAGIVK